MRFSGLEQQPRVTVRTAAALRASADLLEVFPLIDQADQFDPYSAAGPTRSATPISTFEFDGRQRFSRDDIHGLQRVILILHAVLAECDHSSGTYDSWRAVGRKLLSSALDGETDRYPELQRLLSRDVNAGLTLDCERIISELSTLWSVHGRGPRPEQIRQWAKAFHPLALSFTCSDSMRNVFNRAHAIIKS